MAFKKPTQGNKPDAAGRNASQAIKVSPEETLTAEARALFEGDDSLEAVRQHRIMNRLRLVQALSKDELKEAHGEGSFVLPALNQLVCSKDQAFLFCAVFFFDEWCKWSDREDKASPAILERSLDPRSEVAKRADSYEDRIETYGDKKSPFEARYVHHLNFAGMIVGDHPLAGVPMVLTFDRGCFRAGQMLASSMLMPKNGRAIPMWAQVFTVSVEKASNVKGTWWVPSTTFAHVLTDVEALQKHRDLHQSLKADWEAKALSVDHETATDREEDEEAPTGSAPF